MRIFRLPERPRAFLFDLDSTLYTNPGYAAFQNDVLVRELARSRGADEAHVLAEVEAARARASERTGMATSLGNAMVELGVDIATSVAWRKRLIRPEEWLKADARLERALSQLAERFDLAVVTNNPGSVGRASLRTLGVERCFRAVVGLDDTMVSKPAREPFELAARLLGAAIRDCIAVGDRFDVDLAVPLELGMGAVLVDGAEDVLLLPSLFI
ncbi:MAG TPA: HAD family hydrolase [Magnetospirillaceae bacterium]|nr:HAD family hydrolase [Magnetospirillaceae bacterium]